jgi:hypothetical protein
MDVQEGDPGVRLRPNHQLTLAFDRQLEVESSSSSRLFQTKIILGTGGIIHAIARLCLSVDNRHERDRDRK